MGRTKEEKNIRLEYAEQLLALHRAIAGSETFEVLGRKLSAQLSKVIPDFSALRYPVVEGKLGKRYLLAGIEPELEPRDAELIFTYVEELCLRVVKEKTSYTIGLQELPITKELSSEVLRTVSALSVHPLVDGASHVIEVLCFILPPSIKIDSHLKEHLVRIAEIVSPAVETIRLRRAYEESLERANALMEVSQIISGKLELRELLTVLARQCSWLLKADRTTVWLYDEENEEIWTIVGEGLRDQIRMPVGVGIAGNVAKTLQTLNIPEPYRHPLFNPEVDKKTGYVTKSILCMPLMNKKGELIGVYQVLNKLDHPHFTRSDEELLASLSGSAAVAIENARLYEEQKKQFNSFIEVLATSVDAKDPTTYNHSRMVTGICVALAKELKFPPQRVEFIRVAAVLHDYGKIAIPDAILGKPGKLDKEEYKKMKSHVSETIEILSKVYFSKEMRDVPRVAGMHHERIDGTGYPLGLKDGEISLEGRIMAVADIFHAMMQERPYKKGLSPQEALAECKKLTAPHIGRFGDPEGVHLDKDVVNALEKILERVNFDANYFLEQAGWSDIASEEVVRI